MKISKKIIFSSCIVTLVATFGIIGIFKVFGSSKPANTYNYETNIPVAMALDDNYLYPTIVAMTSVLENADSKTKYDFYIMHPAEFKEENKIKLKSLEKKYQKCKINTIDMGNDYKDANSKGLATPAYYRLSLSGLLPDINKIIWLDGDTITNSDLKEMYNINMEGYYYKGYLDDNVHAVENFTKENDHCICTGVMLVNLEELRKDDMLTKFSEFIKENNDRLIQHDQTTINALAYKKVGILPAKFGIYNYQNVNEAEEKSKVYLYKNGYSSEELQNAYLNPVILHCVCKPWKSRKVYGGTKWWDYAEKTDFYNEISSFYKI